MSKLFLSALIFSLALIGLTSATTSTEALARRQCSVNTALVCERSTLKLSCPVGTIVVVSASYGRKDNVTCPYKDCFNAWNNQQVCLNAYTTKLNLNCDSSIAQDIIRNQCNGKSSCNVIIENSLLGGDPCYLTYKYATARYICIR